MQRYLDDRLRLVDEALSRANALLLDRLVDAIAEPNSRRR